MGKRSTAEEKAHISEEVRPTHAQLNKQKAVAKIKPQGLNQSAPKRTNVNNQYR